MVYFEKDRNSRELARIEETLGAKGITYKLLDVTGDEPALDFVMREAHCEQDELPVVFVGGAAVGGFRELVEADVSGELQRALLGG
jgi:glutaredoxin